MRSLPKSFCILRYLSKSDTTFTILVSRQLRSLSEPLLYRTVRLHANTAYSEPYGNFDGDDLHVHLRQSTSTIVTRPKLGTYVKELLLDQVWDLVPNYDTMDDCANCNVRLDVTA